MKSKKIELGNFKYSVKNLLYWILKENYYKNLLANKTYEIDNNDVYENVINSYISSKALIFLADNVCSDYTTAETSNTIKNIKELSTRPARRTFFNKAICLIYRDYKDFVKDYDEETGKAVLKNLKEYIDWMNKNNHQVDLSIIDFVKSAE